MNKYYASYHYFENGNMGFGSAELLSNRNTWDEGFMTDIRKGIEEKYSMAVASVAILSLIKLN